MIRMRVNRKIALFLSILSILMLAGGYALLSRHQRQANPEDKTIPGWEQLKEGVRMAFEPDPLTGQSMIGADSVATLQRLFFGLLIGLGGAILIGLFMGCYPWIESLLLPPLSFLAKVPPTAALAVFFVLAGTDLPMFVAMIAFGVLPSLAVAIHLAVKEVPAENIYKAYTLGASSPELIWNVVFKQVLPGIINGIRLQIGPAMVYLIAAEFLAAEEGFGYTIRIQSRLVNMNIVYFYLVLLAGFGFLMDVLLKLLNLALCPWHERSAER